MAKHIVKWKHQKVRLVEALTLAQSSYDTSWIEEYGWEYCIKCLNEEHGLELETEEDLKTHVAFVKERSGLLVEFWDELKIAADADSKLEFVDNLLEHLKIYDPS